MRRVIVAQMISIPVWARSLLEQRAKEDVMSHVTPAAHHHLIQLLSEHPEERLVRIEMKDIDDHRIAFNIALESDEKPDDAVHVCDGLTIAVAANSVAR